MPLFVYRCPNTQVLIQGFVLVEPKQDDTETYQSISCPICQGIHLAKPATGKVVDWDNKPRVHSRSNGPSSLEMQFQAASWRCRRDRPS